MYTVPCSATALKSAFLFQSQCSSTIWAYGFPRLTAPPPVAFHLSSTLTAWVHTWKQKHVVKDEAAWEPQTGAINNTIPRMVVVISAAERSIRRNLRTRVQRGQRRNGNKIIISARFPDRSTTIHHCFIKIEQTGLRTATRMSSDRWLITAPAVAPAPFIARQVPSYSRMRQFRWLRHNRSHYSHHYNTEEA